MVPVKMKGLLPNTFTMGNVICGFLAILSAFEGQLTTACWLIILAGFLDALDGKIARYSGSTSQFGVELDSLADFLSFGIAPAIIVYIAKLQFVDKWGWIIALVYIMAASYRLARYNVMIDEDEKKDFSGLPTPVPALALVSFVIFNFHLFEGLRYGDFLLSMMILFAALMVSQIEYEAVPDNFNSPAKRLRLIIIVVAAAATLFKPHLLLFPFIAMYIIIGLVREIYRFFHLGVGLVKKRRGKHHDATES
jgi:CDP-diacylglycerol--serine O-phosphatidyltransferase